MYIGYSIPKKDEMISEEDIAYCGNICYVDEEGSIHNQELIDALRMYSGKHPKDLYVYLDSIQSGHARKVRLDAMFKVYEILKANDSYWVISVNDTNKFFNANFVVLNIKYDSTENKYSLSNGVLTVVFDPFEVGVGLSDIANNLTIIECDDEHIFFCSVNKDPHSPSEPTKIELEDKSTEYKYGETVLYDFYIENYDRLGEKESAHIKCKSDTVGGIYKKTGGVYPLMNYFNMKQYGCYDTHVHKKIVE